MSLTEYTAHGVVFGAFSNLGGDLYFGNGSWMVV